MTTPPRAPAFADLTWRQTVTLSALQQARLSLSPALQQLQLADDPDPTASTPWPVVAILGASTPQLAERAITQWAWNSTLRDALREPLQEPRGDAARAGARLVLAHARASRLAHARAGVPLSPWRQFETQIWERLWSDLQWSWEDSLSLETVGSDWPERPTWAQFVQQAVGFDFDAARGDESLARLERTADRAALSELRPEETFAWVQQLGPAVETPLLHEALEIWSAAHWTADTLDWIATRQFDAGRPALLEAIVARHGAHLEAEALEALAWVALINPMPGALDEHLQQEVHVGETGWSVSQRASLLASLRRHGWRPTRAQARTQGRIGDVVRQGRQIGMVSDGLLQLSEMPPEGPVLPLGVTPDQIGQDPTPLAVIAHLLTPHDDGGPPRWVAHEGLDAALAALPLPPDPRVAPPLWRDLLRHSGRWPQELRLCVLRHFGRLHGTASVDLSPEPPPSPLDGHGAARAPGRRA